MNNKIFLVAGGDLRQVYLAASIGESDKVYAIGFDKNLFTPENVTLVDSLMQLPERVDYIILPLPVSNDNVMVNTPFYKKGIPLNNLTSAINSNGIIFGGKFSLAVKELFDKYNLKTIDYLEREELSVLNAIPTAEGAIQIAMEELPTTIHGLNTLVTGMGRISKVLIKILTGLGAKTSVTARKYSDIAWAEISGSKGIHISKIDEYIGNFDLIINTVPARLLNEERLAKLKKDCLVIDLASKPGGVDFDTANRLGIKTIWALSLPLITCC